MDRKGGFILWFILLTVLVGITSFLYILEKDETLQMVLLVILIILGLFGSIVLWFEYMYAPSIIRRDLKVINKLLLKESPSSLQAQYLHIYDHYLKLSEKQKANFYGRIAKVREQLEAPMKAEKNLQELLNNASKGNLAVLQREYETASALLQKLPAKVKEMYAAPVAQLRDALEKGT